MPKLKHKRTPPPEALREHLHADEHLLWWARPRLDGHLDGDNWLLLPLGIFLGTAGLLLTRSFGQEIAFFALVVALSGYGIVPAFYRRMLKQQRRTLYAITHQRALLLKGDALTALKPGDWAYLRVIERDLIFMPPLPGHTPDPPAFCGLDDPEAVRSLLETVFQNTNRKRSLDK